MLSPRSYHGKAMAEILSDRQWHAKERLLSAGSPLVPYGQAVRAALSQRYRVRGNKPLVVNPDIYESRRMDTYAAGARQMCCTVLDNWRRKGHIETDGHGNYRLVS